jgi:hypothetical protein
LEYHFKHNQGVKSAHEGKRPIHIPNHLPVRKRKNPSELDLPNHRTGS